jgi:hypothetical protein
MMKLTEDSVFVKYWRLRIGNRNTDWHQAEGILAEVDKVTFKSNGD